MYFDLIRRILYPWQRVHQCLFSRSLLSFSSRQSSRQYLFSFRVTWSGIPFFFRRKRTKVDLVHVRKDSASRSNRHANLTIATKKKRERRRQPKKTSSSSSTLSSSSFFFFSPSSAFFPSTPDENERKRCIYIGRTNRNRKIVCVFLCLRGCVLMARQEFASCILASTLRYSSTRRRQKKKKEKKNERRYLLVSLLINM